MSFPGRLVERELGGPYPRGISQEAFTRHFVVGFHGFRDPSRVVDALDGTGRRAVADRRSRVLVAIVTRG
jgi:hypothetical protein